MSATKHIGVVSVMRQKRQVKNAKLRNLKSKNRMIMFVRLQAIGRPGWN